jgi:hypothetical protein
MVWWSVAAIMMRPRPLHGVELGAADQVNNVAQD